MRTATSLSRRRRRTDCYSSQQQCVAHLYEMIVVPNNAVSHAENSRGCGISGAKRLRLGDVEKTTNALTTTTTTTTHKDKDKTLEGKERRNLGSNGLSKAMRLSDNSELVWEGRQARSGIGLVDISRTITDKANNNNNNRNTEKEHDLTKAKTKNPGMKWRYRSVPASRIATTNTTRVTSMSSNHSKMFIGAVDEQIEKDCSVFGPFSSRDVRWKRSQSQSGSHMSPRNAFLGSRSNYYKNLTSPSSTFTSTATATATSTSTIRNNGSISNCNSSRFVQDSLDPMENIGYKEMSTTAFSSKEAEHADNHHHHHHHVYSTNSHNQSETLSSRYLTNSSGIPSTITASNNSNSSSDSDSDNGSQLSNISGHKESGGSSATPSYPTLPISSSQMDYVYPQSLTDLRKPRDPRESSSHYLEEQYRNHLAYLQETLVQTHDILLQAQEEKLTWKKYVKKTEEETINIARLLNQRSESESESESESTTESTSISGSQASSTDTLDHRSAKGSQVDQSGALGHVQEQDRKANDADMQGVLEASRFESIDTLLRSSIDTLSTIPKGTRCPSRQNTKPVWFASAIPHVETYQAAWKSTKQKPTSPVKNAIASLDPALVLSIAYVELMVLSTTEPTGVRYSEAARNIGHALRLALKSFFVQESVADVSNMSNTDQALSMQADSTKEWEKSFSNNNELFKVGAHLTEIVLDHATIRNQGNIEKGFTHEIRYRAKRSTGYVIPHPETVRIGIKLNVQNMAAMPSSFLKPMYTMPLSWTDVRNGGYLFFKVPIVRRHDLLHKQLDAMKRSSMDAVYGAISALGATPWQVNRGVYDTLREIQREKLDMAELGETGINVKDLAPIRATETEKQKPPALVPDNIADLSPRQVRQLEKEHETFEQERTEELRLKTARRITRIAMVHQKLAAASELLDVHSFWTPYTMDFRGRVYPVASSLNHTGDDLSRGLLRFSAKRRLGEDGLYWLKVHLANVMGHDKVSLDDRVAWVDEHLQSAIDSGKEPISRQNPTERKWWLGSDDPIQALAACMELANAYNLPNPEDFYSNLPVQVDGTCNGLQHYAALGRDQEGGTAVNLCPQAKPADVYSKIATDVRDKLEELHDEFTYLLETEDQAAVLAQVKDDILNYYQTSGKERKARMNSLRPYLSWRLHDRVDRKLVKQTVMTSVYGVTNIGAIGQVRERLKEANVKALQAEQTGAQTLPPLEKNMISISSVFLAECILESIRYQFQSASSIMTLLKGLSSAVTRNGNSVSWLTPLGFPVLQPYMEQRRRVVKTNQQHVLYYETDKSARVASQKHGLAFPPNFIHSLDSAHMMMTAQRAFDEGLYFASVHDSFWCHACDIPRLNQILREEFVKLHTPCLVEDIIHQFWERYPDSRAAFRKLIPKESGEEVNGEADEEDNDEAIDDLLGNIHDPGKTPENGDEDEDEDIDVMTWHQSKSEDGGDDSHDSGTEKESRTPTVGEKRLAEIALVVEADPTRKRLSPESPPPLRVKGTLDLEEVKSSKYFFS